MLEIRLGVKGDPVASKAYFREYLRELKRYTPKLTTLHTVITHYMSHYERANYGFPYERAEVYGSHLLSHHINSPSLIRERLLKWTTPEIMIRMNELKAKFFRAADLSISAAGQGVDPQTIQTDVRDLIPRTLTHFERGLRPKLLKTEMIQEPLFVALEQAEANTQGNGVSVAFNYLLQALDVHSEVRLGVLKSFFANLLHTELRERLHLGYAHVFRANMTAHTKTWILQAISQTDRPQDLGLITETWNMMLAALKKGFTNDQEDLIRSLIRSQRMSAREYNGDNFELAYANLKSLSIHGISWPEYIAIHQEALRSEDPAEYTSLIRRVFGESKPVLKIVTGLKFEETPKVVSDDCAKVFEHSRDAAEYLRRIMGR
jgi:secreted Zn-dependent insulinase-like peptidase